MEVVVANLGGDIGLISDFIKAVGNKDQGIIRAGVQETLDSHLIVFCAEEARLLNKVIDFQEWKKQFQ